jgi:hypothetical protein
VYIGATYHRLLVVAQAAATTGNSGDALSTREAGGKADELLAGEREAGQLSHPANFPDKLSVVLPIWKQPVRALIRHPPVLAVAQSL